MTENEVIEGFKIDNALLGENESGTVERNNIAIKCIEELQEYRAIGTIEELKALKEKNEPEKPLFVPTDDTCLYHEYRCPSCNEWLADKFKPYRCKCGKLLDWQ